MSWPALSVAKPDLSTSENVDEDIRCSCADFAYWHNESIALLRIEKFNDPSRHSRNCPEMRGQPSITPLPFPLLHELRERD
jgi:hypothetical protein